MTLYERWTNVEWRSHELSMDLIKNKIKKVSDSTWPDGHEWFLRRKGFKMMLLYFSRNHKGVNVEMPGPIGRRESFTQEFVQKRAGMTYKKSVTEIIGCPSWPRQAEKILRSGQSRLRSLRVHYCHSRRILFHVPTVQEALHRLMPSIRTRSLNHLVVRRVRP